MCGLFILSFLDRVNLSYAALDMTRDLGFGPSVYGLGAGLFFAGYLSLELPATRLIAQGSARFWLAIMVMAWGAVAAAMGFVQGVADFYLYRVLLGIAEAGFFPGIIVYLSRWFPARDRARAVSALAVGLPAANLLAGPLSALLLRQHWGHLQGWRWLFVMEGLPSVAAGVLTLRYLTDTPKEADWLSREEQEWLQDTLDSERSAVVQNAPGIARSGLLNSTLIVLASVWFLDNMGVYGFNFWLPLMIQRVSGYSSATVALIAASPFVGALLAAALVPLSSDRSRERRWHAAVPMATFSAGLALSTMWSHRPLLALALLCVAALGLTSGTPAFWAFATSSEDVSGSAAIAIITSAGALGGFCGPYVMGSLRSLTNTFSAGLLVLSAAVWMAAMILVLGTKCASSQSRTSVQQ